MSTDLEANTLAMPPVSLSRSPTPPRFSPALRCTSALVDSAISTAVGESAPAPQMVDKPINRPRVTLSLPLNLVYQVIDQDAELASFARVLHGRGEAQDASRAEAEKEAVAHLRRVYTRIWAGVFPGPENPSVGEKPVKRRRGRPLGSGRGTGRGRGVGLSSVFSATKRGGETGGVKAGGSKTAIRGALPLEGKDDAAPAAAEGDVQAVLNAIARLNGNPLPLGGTAAGSLASKASGNKALKGAKPKPKPSTVKAAGVATGLELGDKPAGRVRKDAACSVGVSAKLGGKSKAGPLQEPKASGSCGQTQSFAPKLDSSGATLPGAAPTPLGKNDKRPPAKAPPIKKTGVAAIIGLLAPANRAVRREAKPAASASPAKATPVAARSASSPLSDAPELNT